MREFLFDIPWWIPAGLAAAGIVIWISGNKRVERRITLIGFLAILLAVALALVSYFGQTDVEKARNQAKRMIDAIAQQNWTALRANLDPETTFAFYGNREQIIQAAKDAARRYGFKSAHTLSMQARQYPGEGTIIVSFDALSTQDATTERPILSSWELEWHETDQGWVLYTIRLIRVGQVSGEQLRNRLPPPGP